ncbi:MAG TPA: aldo/keto reductase [Caulobacteraceae bacterium]|nr:aldo/keto reductase [Caulobacteraceae bacterium]
MSVPRATLAPDYEISRLIKGGWHLAGGHGDIDRHQAIADMAAFVEAGITTFDCADIYTGVEALIGDFRRAHPSLARRTQVHTKFVPDLADLAQVDRAYVERTVDRSLARLGVERIDLVQFHWWDFATPGYVEAALELERQRRAGKIRNVAVTNFDTPHLAELIEAGAPIFAHQLQYSLLDTRPDSGMAAYCAEKGVHLLCYGTVAGGFFSERWLDRPAPRGDLGNRSLVKYRLIVEEFGGWALFQQLLGALSDIAAKHGADIATIATRAVLDRPGVAAAIVGATNRTHLAAHVGIGEVKLDDADRAAIESVCKLKKGPGGDVYALERDRKGPHGRIMKYELNNA